MNRLNRRSFLWLAGAVGAAPPVAAALDLAGQAKRQTAEPSRADLYTFRAVAALPKQPLPAYASYVLTGHLDLGTRAGMITQTVFAGGPTAMSEIALPGLSRSMRVTAVDQVGDSLNVTGVVDDRSQLQPGESPRVEIRVDRGRGIVLAGFRGSPTQLDLVG
jgi:hypothetical protein